MEEYNLVFGSTPTSIDLAFLRRETAWIQFTLYTTSSLSTPYDLTNADVYAEVRVTDGSTLLLDLEPSISVTETDGVITIKKIVPDSLEAQTAQWDMLLVLPTLERIYIARGAFRIDPSITDIDP